MRDWKNIRVDTMEPADVVGDKHIKTVEFETYMVDEDDNIIGIKVINEDGKECHKVVEDCGNHVAVAMEVLSGLEIPLGTRIKVNIEIDKENVN